MGITQKTVADATGISVACYSNYERQERQPDFLTLSKLADFFNVSLDYLVGRESEWSGLNLSLKKTDLEIAISALNDRQKELLLIYARGLLAGEGKDLDEILRIGG